MTPIPARMRAGILQPARAAGDRCMHCSLSFGRGCRCNLSYDDRRPDTEPQPIGSAPTPMPWLSHSLGMALGRA